MKNIGPNKQIGIFVDEDDTLHITFVGDPAMVGLKLEQSADTIQQALEFAEFYSYANTTIADIPSVIIYNYSILVKLSKCSELIK